MTGANVFLLTAAATLVPLGVNTIQTNLWTGVVEFLLGVGAFVAYELTPPSK